MGEEANLIGYKKVIDHLNEVWQAEFTAANQLVLDAEMLKHWGFPDLAWRVRQHSIGSLRHAEAMLGRILFLGGPPPRLTGTLASLAGQCAKEQVENALALARMAAPCLHQAIKLAAEARDDQSRNLLEAILADREAQVDWLAVQLYMIRELGIEHYRATYGGLG